MSLSSVPRRVESRARAFTLVELLVVIGIIGLLISILLPSLNKARHSAATIKCSANLHSIMLGIQIYATNNRDYIPGSPNTTGRFLFDAAGDAASTVYTSTNCPNVTACFDWQSPVASAIGVRLSPDDTTFVEPSSTPHFNSGPDSASRLSRFEFLRTFPPFTCPENQAAIWTGYGTPLCATNIAISYSMAEEFLLVATPAGNAYGSGILYPGSNPVYPNGYSPKMGKIRNSSSKICMADGSRYVAATSSSLPDYSLSVTGSGGGSWADGGSWTQGTHCWPRASPSTPLGLSGVTTDWRPLIYRHGLTTTGGAPGRYYMNVAFFDGHVQTMDDVSSSNPALWLPSGSVLTCGSTAGNFGTIWTDTATKFNYTAGSTVLIP